MDFGSVHLYRRRLGSGRWAGVAWPSPDALGGGPWHSPLHANRWLVLSITLAVVLRLCFSVVRIWQLRHEAPEGSSWVAQAGLGGSMAAGAAVLGYYLIFWTGVWILSKKHGR